jgi:hypothetical protein
MATAAAIAQKRDREIVSINERLAALEDKMDRLLALLEPLVTPEPKTKGAVKQ